MEKDRLPFEADINKIINFSEHLRKKMIIPSLQLQNFLNFQHSQIIPKTVFNCCTTEKTSVPKSFKRAFRTLNKLQQANYYLKCIRFILSQIYPANNKAQDSQIQIHQSNKDLSRKQNKFDKFTVKIKKQGPFKKWVTCKIQIATQLCVLRLIETDQELDLNHYIFRQSKSKNMPSIVLQSTQDLAEPTTLKISNHNESLEKIRKRLQLYIDKALKLNIARLLKKNRLSSSTQYRNSIKTQINIHPNQEVKNEKNKDHHQQSSLIPATLLLAEGINAKSMRKIISQAGLKSISQKQNKKIYKKLITHQQLFSLSSFKDYEETSPNTFFNKKQQKTRRIFLFDSQQMSYEWLVTQMNCYKMFKKWKSCLFLINLLAELPQQKTKIYHEINLYKDYSEVDYVFLRHLFSKDGVNYFIDKSINSEEYGSTSNVSRGNIQYCLWRFKQTGKSIQVLVQISLKNIKVKNIHQIAVEYIGDVKMLQTQYIKDKRTSSQTFKTIHNANLFLFEDESQLNGENSETNSPFKRKQMLRMDSRDSERQINTEQNKNIQKKEQEGNKNVQKKKQDENKPIQKIQFPTFLDSDKFEVDEMQELNDLIFQKTSTQYFSLVDSSDEEYDKQPIKLSDCDEQQVNNYQIKSLQRKDCKSDDQIEINMLQKKCVDDQPVKNIEKPFLNSQFKYLFKRHFISPQIKNKLSKPKESSEQKGHFLWKNQWKVTQKGELININKKQAQLQSGVLKMILKKMGRNLLAGKSILNLSLPIQIFGTDSNLQRLCKSMAYAPRFLQYAAKLQSPLQRIKRAICFGIGYSLCYIEMQKPFNPILGQTYQGIVDGCPIYGQQISHHPPISTIFFKGRGYYAYGNFQAKVQMGMNSASGINEGFMRIAFSENNTKQNLISMTGPPGQISGLVYGQRKLTLTRKTYYLDEQNMILGIIEWGSQKKKNQISFNNDYLEGKIVKLKSQTDLKRLDKIKDANYQEILCNIKGRWTDKIYFDNQVLFDISTDGPFEVEQYDGLLRSNVDFRQDIILRKQNKIVEAQQAKQKLEEIQRNDRKLRKKYEKS